VDCCSYSHPGDTSPAVPPRRIICELNRENSCRQKIARQRLRSAGANRPPPENLPPRESAAQNLRQLRGASINDRPENNAIRIRPRPITSIAIDKRRSGDPIFPAALELLHQFHKRFYNPVGVLNDMILDRSKFYFVNFYLCFSRDIREASTDKSIFTATEALQARVMAVYSMPSGVDELSIVSVISSAGPHSIASASSRHAHRCKRTILGNLLTKPLFDRTVSISSVWPLRAIY